MTPVLYAFAALGLVFIALICYLIVDTMRHAARRTEAEAERLRIEDEAHERAKRTQRPYAHSLHTD